MPVITQKNNIQTGALWPMIKELGLYSCPTGTRGELVTYAVTDAMNGLNRSGQGTATAGEGTQTAVGKRVGKTVLWIKKITEITSPGPADRMVFIDEGWVTPDSFATNYNTGSWWDDPPVRHGDGVTIGMADGHADYWKWTGSKTIKEGRKRQRGHPSNTLVPTSEEDWADIIRMQTSVLGPDRIQSADVLIRRCGQYRRIQVPT